MQNVKLRRGAVDRHSMALDGAGTSVEDQVIGGEKRTAESRRTASAKHTADSCQQLDGCERLGYVVIGAGLESAHFVCHGSSGRKHDHRDAALFANLA